MTEYNDQIKTGSERRDGNEQKQIWEERNAGMRTRMNIEEGSGDGGDA